MLSLTLAVLSLLRLVEAVPARAELAVVKKPSELLETYDFIVVGAGTAGLTVADRLSENGRYTVLAVEYGYLDSSPEITLTGPGSRIVGINSGLGSGSRFYNLSSEPLEGTSGSRYQVSAGCIVGGSSAVNGMIFDRGSAEDYDAWVWAAGDQHKEAYGKEWGWKNLLPWFKKSVTFHPPSDEVAKQYGMTYDVEAAYGGNTPIHSSYPPYQWPAHQKIFSALKEMPGIETPREHADGHAVGLIWHPSSIEPVNRTRSYARLGHFDANGISARQNFHLLPGYRVTQLDLSETSGTGSPVLAANGVWIAPRDIPMNGSQRIQATREIILSAGSVHTPQILQRSGIGPKDVLDAAGVKVKLELPGVGANLQDHAGYRATYRFNTTILPDESTLSTNRTFFAEANELWKNNKTGPLAAYPNSMALVPLPVLTNQSDAIITAMLAQDPAAYLPNGTHPTVVAGYTQQLKALAQQYRSHGSAVLEMPLGSRGSFTLLLLKPLSRGRIRISPNDDGTNVTSKGNMEPLLDWRTMTNPLDVVTAVTFVRWVRRFMNTTAMVETFTPTETFPGAGIESQADLESLVRRSSGPSNGHMVGTSALAPREFGGVVGPDLRVHGTRKLSVADNSIITLIPGTHTSSTAYAIGEKAADLILRRAREQESR